MLLVLALLALSRSTPGATKPDRWLEVRSPHFVVISNAGEEHARGVSLQFERVRALLRRVLTNARVDPRDPVVVLAVNNERRLRELLPQFWERKGQRPVAGYWQGPHRHYVVLRVDAPVHEQYRRVLHEYVHLLTHANVPDLPAWLDEGISEFWSTAVVQGDRVEIGRPQTPVSFDPRVDFAIGANTISVLLGTGSGSFGPKTDVSVGAVPHGLALADLNGDGHLDFVVANNGADTVSVLLGNGTGSFTTSAFATGAVPFNLTIGDLNGDGIPDLAMVNVNADTVSVLLGGGDGGFGAKTDFATGGKTLQPMGDSPARSASIGREKGR